MQETGQNVARTVRRVREFAAELRETVQTWSWGTLVILVDAFASGLFNRPRPSTTWQPSGQLIDMCAERGFGGWQADYQASVLAAPLPSDSSGSKRKRKN